VGDLDNTLEELPKRSGQKAGTFWGALIGAVLVSTLSSGGIATGVAKNSAADLKLIAAERALEAEKKARETEEAIALYLNERFRPEIEKAFDEMAVDIAECFDKVEKADREAYAALRILENLQGRRSVERMLDKVESEDKLAKPPEAKAKRAKAVADTELPEYEVQQQTLEDKP